jgi:hypothetical protein
MPNSRTFSSVSAEVLSRMKEVGHTEYRVAFDPPDGPRSTATTQTPFGKCVVECLYDSARAELTLTIVKKPWLLPEAMLWSGFAATLERSRRET